LNIEIPELVTLRDGTTAQVRSVTARVVDGRVGQVVYTVEKGSGAWADVSEDDVVRPERSRAEAAPALVDERSTP
jgi:hypothetical protein